MASDDSKTELSDAVFAVVHRWLDSVSVTTMPERYRDKLSAEKAVKIFASLDDDPKYHRYEVIDVR